MKFKKNLIKVENWCKKNGLNIDRMKDDTYMYQVYTCLEDCLYIEQVMYKKSINFYCVYKSNGVLIGTTASGANTQNDLIELLKNLIFNKNVDNEKLFNVKKECNKDSKNTDNEKEFIDTIKTTLKNNLSNAIFDKYYDGQNYYKLKNNLNDYINIDTINIAINNSKNFIKEYCKIYNKPCRLEYDGNIIYINDNEININF